MRQCSYSNGNFRCKTLFPEDDREFCPIHAGVERMREPKPLTPDQIRFEEKVTDCEKMSNEQLSAHILQLESLLEDVKLRQQAAQHVRSKRVKELVGVGKLTEAQLAEMNKLRDPRQKVEKVSVSPQEKEIQKLMKLNLSREDAMKLLKIS